MIISTYQNQSSWDQYLQRSHWAKLLFSSCTRHFTFWNYEEKVLPTTTIENELKSIWAIRAMTIAVTWRIYPSFQIPSPISAVYIQDVTLKHTKSMFVFPPWQESSRKDHHSCCSLTLITGKVPHSTGSSDKQALDYGWECKKRSSIPFSCFTLLFVRGSHL